ncbi:hypothetical protein DT075_29910 [Bacillus licheniformis]|nr:hypothetical protein DT075_29910 [Bacillus licheniformis]
MLLNFTELYSQHEVFVIFNFFSVIGAFVGYLKSNGSIQMPLLMIDYKRKWEHKNVSHFKNH